jgi:Tol biopolymer transport system component
LSELTGTSIGIPPAITGMPFLEGPLEPPPTPASPETPAGDQIAANCGGRIWVGDADGSDLLALTEGGQVFSIFYWSPDGRWLLTAWQPRRSQPTMALYLLAADGSEGRLLTTDPAIQAWPLGWSADGRAAVFYTTRLDVSGQAAAPEVQAIDVETGATRELPGVPFFSPDAVMLLYVPVSVDWPLGSAWLADADWENARLLEPRVWVWPGEGWSPDGTRLAMALGDGVMVEGGVEESAIGIYDMATERREATLSATDLMQGLSTAEGAFVSDGSDQTALAQQPLPWLTVLGWSADGRHLLVWSQEAGGAGYATGPVALTSIAPDAFVVPPTGVGEGSRVRLLAYGERKTMDAVWSPTDADRLSLTWRSPEGQPEGAYILDLNAGVVYSGTHVVNASWSPDGEWVAWAGEDGVAVTDKDGQRGFQLGVANSLCYVSAWNPAADLSRLLETPRSNGDSREVP